MSVYHPLNENAGVQVRDSPCLESAMGTSTTRRAEERRWAKAGSRATGCGHYDDALRVKKNIVCILLHETSSGFSPPSATTIRRMGRAALSGVDRTPYTTRHKKRSFVAYHTQRISKNIVHYTTRLRRSRENRRCQG